MRKRSQPASNIKYQELPYSNNARTSHQSEHIHFKTRKTKIIKSEFPQITDHHQSRINSNYQLFGAQRSLQENQSYYTHLVNNKHIQYLFREYCKQNYIGGSKITFDQISQSAETMTINKWMVFCKEFYLIDQHIPVANTLKTKQQKLPKINRKQALQIFKRVTNSRVIEYEGFVQALDMIKFALNIPYSQLIHNYLHADSFQAARNRLSCLKISFSPFRKDFFVQSAKAQVVRKQQQIKQMEHKLQVQKHKNSQGKSYILHQGMAQTHILRQIQQRKKIRQQQRCNRSQSSAHQFLNDEDKSQFHLKRKAIHESDRSRVDHTAFGGYSRIFKSRKNSNKTFLTNMQYANNRIHQHRKTQSQLNESDFLTKNVNKPIQHMEQSAEIENISQATQHLKNHTQDNKATDFINITESQQILADSDTESDEILRHHYDNEKKMRANIIENSNKHYFVENQANYVQRLDDIRNQSLFNLTQSFKGQIETKRKSNLSLQNKTMDMMIDQRELKDAFQSRIEKEIGNEQQQRELMSPFRKRQFEDGSEKQKKTENQQFEDTQQENTNNSFKVEPTQIEIPLKNEQHQNQNHQQTAQIQTDKSMSIIDNAAYSSQAKTEKHHEPSECTNQALLEQKNPQENDTQAHNEHEQNFALKQTTKSSQLTQQQKNSKNSTLFCEKLNNGTNQPSLNVNRKCIDL